MRLGVFGGVVAALIIVALIVAYGTLFTVYQTRQALVVRLGQPMRVVTRARLHFKIPLIDSVIYIDKRILDLENPAQEVIASDQKRLVVDAFARYRIKDPLQFYQIGRHRSRAPIRGCPPCSIPRCAACSARRPSPRWCATSAQQLMARVREQLDERGAGLRHHDRRCAHPPRRPAGAEQPGGLPAHADRAPARGRRIPRQGSQRAQEIRASADRDVTVLLAEAQSKAEQIRGEGDAERNRIFAEAFGRDPDFFAFYRSMQAYEAGLRSNDTRMVLKPDSDFFRYFADPSGKPRDGAARPRIPPALRLAAACGTPGAITERHRQLAASIGEDGRFPRRDRSGACDRRPDLRRFSGAAKRLAASALETPEASLRIAGIVSAVLGVVLIWLVRG